MRSKTPDALSVDFAALDTLCRVHGLASFTRAAQALGVNQSAVSYTIEKLRRVFGDPLFVKEAGNQVPTPRCDAIVTQSRRLLDSYRDMATSDTFDPSVAQAEITIACNYYERVLMIPIIARRFQKEAPGIRLTIVNSSSDGALRLLEGQADLLLGPFQPGESGIYIQELFDEEYVCLMDPDHPAAQTVPDMSTYLTFNHLAVTYGGTWKSRFLQVIEDAGHDLNITMKVPSPAGIGQLVTGTQLVATVPARLAQRIGAEQAIVPCPVPAEFKLTMVWTARTQSSPLHNWVRATIRECLDEGFG
ncbi:LysR family transcriptional regulator [Flavimaricola marinus]|uniref:HTH-type transcriptional regulator SyrM 1 n=1 Tax=Flavimaricola marinus TaxID=1819565 RepID=A0A238LGP8_9RHOB|nr:LysR family transcriptional regulator [Flavimaricola marinus]SMY08869.1 HTH-type transcriptional regulator SyrM 1 [Flavimaricola marinus]